MPRLYTLTTMSAQGQFRPLALHQHDGGLSPDSCRAGRTPMTAELGQNLTHALRETSTQRRALSEADVIGLGCA
jgi:hypothetical protein